MSDLIKRITEGKPIAGSDELIHPDASPVPTLPISRSLRTLTALVSAGASTFLIGDVVGHLVFSAAVFTLHLTPFGLFILPPFLASLAFSKYVNRSRKSWRRINVIDQAPQVQQLTYQLHKFDEIAAKIPSSNQVTIQTARQGLLRVIYAANQNCISAAKIATEIEELRRIDSSQTDRLQQLATDRDKLLNTVRVDAQNIAVQAVEELEEFYLASARIPTTVAHEPLPVENETLDAALNELRALTEARRKLA